jgi:hypothetical protein
MTSGLLETFGRANIARVCQGYPVIKPSSAANPAFLTRREFTLGIGASAITLATPRPAKALGGPELLLILISVRIRE